MKIPKFEAQTEWVKPTEFPDLRQVDEIAIDLETRDILDWCVGDYSLKEERLY